MKTFPIISHKDAIGIVNQKTRPARRYMRPSILTELRPDVDWSILDEDSDCGETDLFRPG